MNTYNAIPGNVSLASAVQVSVPADGVDSMAVSTVNTGLQKEADYLEAIRQLIIGVGIPINEGFEGTTFPPASPSGAWSSPSTNFNADSAWLRKTVGPLVGVASASAPTPQTLSTNSSMGLFVFLSCPSRLQFVFAITCNANNGDHLDFFIDGVLTAQFSSTTGPTAVAGTFYTDLIREGSHSFDWRFVRGASTSVASEKCIVDSVQIISADGWRADSTFTRVEFFDDLGYGINSPAGTSFNLPGTGANVLYGQLWVASSSNVGNVRLESTGVSLPPSPVGWGEIVLSNAGIAVGDTVQAFLSLAYTPAQFTLAKSPFVEWRASPRCTAPTTALVDLGFAGSGQDYAGWTFDGSVSTANWRWRTRTSAGVQTDVDSGVSAPFTAYARLGTIASTVGGISSIIFTKDGKALPGAGNIPPILVTNLPTNVEPIVRVKTITSPSIVQVLIDSVRYLGLR